MQLAGGRELPYALSLPEDRSGPRPLVLALHYGWGGGAVPPGYEAGFLSVLVEPALRELGAVIVAPRCPGRSWEGPGVEEAVLALLDEIGRTHEVDPARTLVTGFSLGGAGTWALAARHPERFRAAVALAGWPRQEHVEALEVPLYAIHSRVDTVVDPAATLAAVESLEGRGVPVQLVLVDGIGHHETARYVPALREAVPWIRATWSAAGR